MLSAMPVRDPTGSGIVITTVLVAVSIAEIVSEPKPLHKPECLLRDRNADRVSYQRTVATTALVAVSITETVLGLMGPPFET